MVKLSIPLFASETSSELLLNTLSEVSKNASSLLDGVWSLFLQGDLYRLSSESASVFLIVPMGWFLINSFRNRNMTKFDERQFTGDFITYLVLGLMLQGLFFPTQTGSLLFGARNTTVAFGNRLVESANKLAGDPNAAMATIVAGKTSNAAGLGECNRIADDTARTACIKDLGESSGAIADQKGGGFDDVVKNAIDLSLTVIDPSGVSKLITAPDQALLVIVVPFLLTIGSAFLILLEAGQLMCCILFPWILLVGIGNRKLILDWLKSFWSWSLIQLAYKLIMVSVAFGMLTAEQTSPLLYGVIAGLGAPFLAFQVISGNSLGLVSAAGSIAGSLIRR